jgi:hypothetical protein
MQKYKVVPFASGSAPLDRLVAKAQRIPKDKIVSAMFTGGAPQQGTLDSCLGVIGRISSLSGKSPGASSIPQALDICWGVYLYLQCWVMQHSIVAKSTGYYQTTSLQGLTPDDSDALL